MGTDLFKYIFDESKKDGCKGVISVIIKIAVFFICLSPVFVYFLLYQTIVVREYNIFISSTLILGCGSLLFFLIFSSAKTFSFILLLKKIKSKSNLSIEEKEHYYFKKSFIITTIFQGILSLLIIISYYYNNPSNLVIKQFNELIFVIIAIITFIIVSFILWIIFLLKYIKSLEKENDMLKIGRDMKNDK
ncbi:hypothetical protein KQI89_05450 [Clostridium sp. MSJ-4]|uniref:DUF3278 domain-containing protein n=1 Tax=Clostridium simiarum TaxID=2841506 RepID=A0ABS6F0Q8_9CLOT|nr:hypothetical protein [Clostridium simiarum]MBU5591203.1 hypothetical protein [Clostridium simiarum]